MREPSFVNDVDRRRKSSVFGDAPALETGIHTKDGPKQFVMHVRLALFLKTSL